MQSMVVEYYPQLEEMMFSFVVKWLKGMGSF